MMKISVCGIMLTGGMAILVATVSEGNMEYASPIVFLSGMFVAMISAFFLNRNASFQQFTGHQVNGKFVASATWIIGLCGSFAGITTFVAMQLQFDAAFCSGGIVYSSCGFLMVLAMFLLKYLKISETSPIFGCKTVGQAAMLLAPLAFAIGSTITLGFPDGKGNLNAMQIGVIWVLFVGVCLSKFAHQYITGKYTPEQLDKNAMWLVVGTVGAGFGTMALFFTEPAGLAIFGCFVPVLIGIAAGLGYWAFKSCAYSEGAQARGFFAK